MVENTGAADVRFTSGEIAELNAAVRARDQGPAPARYGSAALGPRSAAEEMAVLTSASSPFEAMYWKENGAYQ